MPASSCRTADKPVTHILDTGTLQGTASCFPQAKGDYILYRFAHTCNPQSRQRERWSKTWPTTRAPGYFNLTWLPSQTRHRLSLSGHIRRASLSLVGAAFVEEQTQAQRFSKSPLFNCLRAAREGARGSFSLTSPGRPKPSHHPRPDLGQLPEKCRGANLTSLATSTKPPQWHRRKRAVRKGLSTRLRYAGRRRILL